MISGAERPRLAVCFAPFFVSAGQYSPDEEGASTMNKPGIALQLFTVREAAASDLEGALERIAGMGWRHVQWSGMPDLPAAEIRRLLDKHGLEAVAGHAPVEFFEQDYAAAAAHWKTIGVRDIAPGGMMQDCQATRDAWLEGCARLDALGARLREESGIRLSYHNHAFELASFPGDADCKLELIRKHTQAGNLGLELDTAWLEIGGASPAAWLRASAGRCPVIHVKDVRSIPGEGQPPAFVPLGEGMLDWPAIFSAAKASGVEWYIYEQDTCEDGVFNALETSLAFLQTHVPG